MSRSMRRPLILAVSAAALGLALSGCISPNTSHESGAHNSSPEPEASATPEAVYLSTLSEGQCYLIPNEEESSMVLPVDCSVPHDGEVLLVETVTPTMAASQDELGDAAHEQCQALLESYVGTPAHDAGVSVTSIVPAGDNWNDGTRTWTCAASATSNKYLTKTLRDSAN